MRRSLDPLEDLVGLDRKLKDLDKRLETAVAATATTLTDIKGVGTATAAMILGEVGDVRRFPSRHHFASYTAAPIEASSGEVERHRLSRAGNRQLNHALHIVALSNKRNDDRGGAYYATKLAAGKGKKGALRCLKPTPCPTPCSGASSKTSNSGRSGARVGTWGRLFNPARPAHTPTPTLRSSHTPGSTTTLHPAFQPRLDTEGSHSGALARRLHRHAEPALPSARLGPCARRRL